MTFEIIPQYTYLLALLEEKIGTYFFRSYGHHSLVHFFRFTAQSIPFTDFQFFMKITVQILK